MNDTFVEHIQESFGMTPAEAAEAEAALAEFNDLLADERAEALAEEFDSQS